MNENKIDAALQELPVIKWPWPVPENTNVVLKFAQRLWATVDIQWMNLLCKTTDWLHTTCIVVFLVSQQFLVNGVQSILWQTIMFIIIIDISCTYRANVHDVNLIGFFKLINQIYVCFDCDLIYKIEGAIGDILFLKKIPCE